ncbi:MAG TPA: metallophosphatase domain-containing protein [Burkholderiales bacterium]|nr:metallophosphatase domain-containing protein [Burkholderiales bacterium]
MIEKIWVISDTHTKHSELRIPDVDIVIHAGDMTNQKGPLNNNEAFSFIKWFDNLSINKKVLIAGNHDSTFFNKEIIFPKYYLEDKLIKYKKWLIYGTPYTPKFYNWYFMLTKEQEITWAKNIPPCDILVTHGPPKFILDSVYREDYDLYEHCGSVELYNRVNKLKPKLHIVGHIHSSYNKKYPENNGVFFNGNTWFINASCCSDGYKLPLTSHGWIVEVNIDTKEIVKIYRNI